MRTFLKYALRALAVLVVAAAIALALVTQSQAHALLTNPRATRGVPTETPATYHLRYEDAVVTTADGLRLAGWYLPGRNGATVIVQHGYKDHRGTMLGLTALL